MNGKKKYRIAFLFAAAIWFLSGAGILAMQTGEWEVEAPTTSVISTGNLSGEIVRETLQTHGGTILPGEKAAHYIYAENTGDQSMFLRLKINRSWDDSDNQLDPELIEVNYIDFDQSEYWYRRSETDEEGNEVIWYYYKELLPAGEKTKEPLTTSYQLSEQADWSYQEETALIDADLECLQATEAAIIDLWGISAQELEIEMPYILQAADKESSYVTFINPEKGFQYSLLEHDILLSFQSIIPGDYNSQNVVVSSEYEGTVTIGMYANYIEQNNYKGDAALVNKLLNEYVHLKIIGRKDTSFYDGPVWQHYTEADKLSEPKENMISLGEFTIGDEKSAVVELTISPEVGNEYQELQGQIQWVFVARGIGEELTGQTGENREKKKDSDVKTEIRAGKINRLPETGDALKAGIYGMFALSSFVILVFLLQYARRIACKRVCL